ncbi:hypothetical protein TR2A62_0101 [Thalassobium sp. R2A62]|nr:hypothetical protein TR2A62_0101 [Thalassobium sp. R2A62]
MKFLKHITHRGIRTYLQSSTVAQAYGSGYLAKNMLENQLAALACKDWGDFRT